MKRYKLTLIPGDKVFDSLFDSKEEASTFVCQYISSHPYKRLTMFDFRLDEYESKITDIATYSQAVLQLGGIEHKTIAVDLWNVEQLTALNELLTIAKVWNIADGTPEFLPHPDKERYFPQFSDDKDDDKHYFCYEYPMMSDHDFGIEALLSFRTKELAEEFSSKFKEKFAKLFNVPFES